MQRGLDAETVAAAAAAAKAGRDAQAAEEAHAAALSTATGSTAAAQARPCLDDILASLMLNSSRLWHTERNLQSMCSYHMFLQYVAPL